MTASLWIDWGSGFEKRDERPLRFNSNGLSYLRFAAEQDGILKLRIDPCDCPAVFRIDWIEVRGRVRGEESFRAARWEGQAQLAGLVYSQCRWVFDGVAVGSTDEPQVHIPLAGIFPPVYHVDVEIALSVLPVAGGGDPAAFAATDLPSRLFWLAARTRSEAAEGGWPAVGKGLLRMLRRAGRS
jgi:hypothetical protein